MDIVSISWSDKSRTTVFSFSEEMSDFIQKLLLTRACQSHLCL